MCHVVFRQITNKTTIFQQVLYTCLMQMLLIFIKFRKYNEPNTTIKDEHRQAYQQRVFLVDL